MRKPLFSAALLAAMFAGGFAFAEQTTGAVKSIDEGAKTVTLSDGTVYSFADTSERHDMLGGYMPGDSVTIVWAMSGDAHQVQSMSPDFSAGVTGKITSINEGESSVTLDSGTTYNFRNDKGETAHLGGHKVGEMVTIVAAKDGNAMVGRSIAAHQPAEVTGKIKAINAGEKTVTMEDGNVYWFQNENGQKVKLGGYKVGDMVKIVAIDVGNTHWGETISTANS